MATRDSVGITVLETDLTLVAAPTSTSTGMYVGLFPWGPAEQIVSVSNERDLIEKFGRPDTNVSSVFHGSFFTAESFLKYGDSLKIYRALAANALNAAAASSDPTTTSAPYLFKNYETFQEDKTDAGATSAIYARCPGSLGDSLKVIVYHNEDSNSLDYFEYVPDATDWASESNITLDEIHIVVLDEDGHFTGQKGAVLESWEGLSLATNATKNGVNNYFADVINEYSQYIFIPVGSRIGSVTSGVGDIAGNNGIIEFSFSGGSNSTTTAATVQAALTSNEILSSDTGENYDMLFAQQFDDDTTINTALSTLIQSRKGAIAFLSAPLGLGKATSDKKTDVLTQYTALSPRTSYIVLDSSPVYVYNKYADTYIWIPACGHLAGLCAYTDEVSDPWFSPAGFNRGQLRGIVKLGYNPSESDRDELYKAGINPIVSFPGQGTLLYGDKTGLTRPSAFDRINVRRLFNTLQKTIRNLAQYQLFELNDEFTRNAFINAVEPYLRDVQGRRGIYDFKIICDETNNTPQVIDTNSFRADIYIKPARSINFISLNFIATRTGVNFSENILGQ